MTVAAYRYVLEEAVFEAFVQLPEDEADLLHSFFRWLAAHPGNTGDGSQTDAVGRTNYASLCGPFLVVHWTDDATREVRVVQIIRD